MSLVVLDIECMDNYIVKELGIYQDGVVKGYSFRPPKDFKPTKQSYWLTSHLHGINWDSGVHEYSDIGQILNAVNSTNAEFFAKGSEKCKFLSNMVQKRVENLDSFLCPNAQQLIFRSENADSEIICSSYPWRHSKTQHCAEQKAHEYGTWMKDHLKILS